MSNETSEFDNLDDRHMDDLARSIGHAISVIDDIWMVTRGTTKHHRTVFSSGDLGEVYEYLKWREQSNWWQLDIDDPTINVAHPRGSGITTTVILTDLTNPDADPIEVHGGVGGDAVSGRIFSVMVREGQVPEIGFWYK